MSEIRKLSQLRSGMINTKWKNSTKQSEQCLPPKMRREIIPNFCDPCDRKQQFCRHYCEEHRFESPLLWAGNRMNSESMANVKKWSHKHESGCRRYEKKTLASLGVSYLSLILFNQISTYSICKLGRRHYFLQSFSSKKQNCKTFLSEC